MRREALEQALEQEGSNRSKSLLSVPVEGFNRFAESARGVAEWFKSLRLPRTGNTTEEGHEA